MLAADDVEMIFAAALDLRDPAQRTAYLDSACGDDAPLRQRIEALLTAYDAGEFLESPAGELPERAFGAPISEHPGSTIGPYKLLEQIGEGGMGLVFMAEQAQPLRRLVALKIIKPGLDTRSVIARFEAERQALAMMDHPNIARVYDAGATDTGRPYFVMELVRGAPITTYCQARNLPLRERLDLFVEVCQAVQHAHQKGIIHRDLKPTNILVTDSDIEPVPKVIDFGVAKATTQPLTDRTLFTHFSQVIGTPLYMSPEQADISNQDIDTRSDVYSLGVVLYELLSGATPFDSDRLRSAGADEMRRILREDDPPKPSTRATTAAAAVSTVGEKPSTPMRANASALKGDLDWIVMKAIDKDRRRRYESPNTLAADIMRYLSNKPVEAAAPSALYRGGKFLRRNGSRVAIAVLVTTGILLASTTYSVALWQRMGQRRELSQRVQETLSGVRTAIEAQDVSLAETLLAEADGMLSNASAPDAELTALVQTTRSETKVARDDEKRYADFVEQTRLAMDEILMGDGSGGNRLASDALALYGIVERAHWQAKLSKSTLDKQRQGQVKRIAYTTLICLADQHVRWRNDAKLAERCLQLLDIAAEIQETTRAWHWVRAQAHGDLKAEAERLRELDRAVSARVMYAWDYFLEGHTAGWHGDSDKAKKSYHQALQIQPDHYSSLFFLALLSLESKEFGVANAYFTACIALRPSGWSAYFNRGLGFISLERFDDAREDFAKCADLTCDGSVKLASLNWLLYASKKMEDKEKIQQANLRLVDFFKQAISKASSSSESSASSIPATKLQLAAAYEEAGDFAHAETLFQSLLEQSLSTPKGEDAETDRQFAGAVLAAYSRALLGQKKYVEAEPLLRESLAISRDLPEDWSRFNSMSMLAESLSAQEKDAEVESLLLDAIEGLQKHGKDIPIFLPADPVCEAMVRLSNYYTRQGQSDEAAKWVKEREAYVASRKSRVADDG